MPDHIESADWILIPKKVAIFLGIEIENDNRLSIRTRSRLKSAGIVFMKDLVSRSEESIRGIEKLGEKSIREILERLEDYGLSAGMIFKEDGQLFMRKP